MNFIMHLQSATQYERIGDVTSFVGEDASGSFGLLGQHERAMTVLKFGLARFQTVGSDWEYLALPGAVLYFTDNTLYVSTRRYIRSSDYEKVVQTLQSELATEEEALRGIKDSVRQLEEEVLRRLWQMRRSGESGI